MTPHDRCGCPDHDHDHDRHHPHDHDREHNAGDGAARGYRGHGVQFRYPAHWTLTEEAGPDETTISVQSTGTSYWTVTLFEERPEPDRVIAAALTAYQDEYKDLDVYEPTAVVQGIPAVAREVDFVCLDLVNSASLIAFQTIDRTVLVTYQGDDLELEATRSILEAMTRSLSCESQRRSMLAGEEEG